MRAWLRIPLQLATVGALAFVTAAAVLTGAYFYVEPDLPSAEELRDVRFQTPLRVYSRDGRLITQYGDEKRTPADLEDIPQWLRDGIIAAEDDSFYEHSGIDFVSTARAVLNYGLQFITRSEGRVAGGSTITQQITRTTNLLPRDYAVGRKISEIFLAFRIEREFTKDEILQLYLNTYFFGQRSYGVVAAARTYFNKTLSELTLSDAAIIAGIPTAPSVNNPYNGPDNAANRRAYVLRRMEELGFIDAAERRAALAEPIVSQKFDVELELAAGYVGDQAIEWCLGKFGAELCSTAGLVIVTTIDSRAQRAANAALRAALTAYDRSHGYRGPIAYFDLATIGFAGNTAEAVGAGVADDNDVAGNGVAGNGVAGNRVAADGVAADAVAGKGADYDSSPTEVLKTLLGDYPDRFGTEAGVVLSVNDEAAEVFLRSSGLVSIGLDAVSWARPYINDEVVGAYPGAVADVLSPGDIVRFRRGDEGAFELAQVPEAADMNGGIDNYVEGALVSLDPMDGAIVALTGGYDREHSPFNRATQAERQPGSSFKPFFYLSALNNGYTLSSIINDVYNCYFDPTLERRHCVENYSNDYDGEIRLREALVKSKNASADRVIRDIGASTAANYVERFGFDPAPGERNASLALGSLAVSPLELATAYSILANGGYAVGIAEQGSGQVRPYFIQRVEDTDGEVLYDSSLSVRMVCPELEDDAAERYAEDRLIAYQAELFPRLRCAERVESEQRIFLITDVLKDVIRVGSGARAGRAFNRSDLAGKTGTTNDQRDTWFAGFNGDLVAVVRIGFDDDRRGLGAGEQGGRTAIPAWIDYMQVMLDGQPEHSLPQPTGVVERRIDPSNGLIAADCNRDTLWEFYLFETQPERESDSACFSGNPTSGGQSSGGQSSGGAGSLFE